MSATKSSYTASQFILTFDDVSDDIGYVKSIDGGFVAGEVITEQVGGTVMHDKHLATVKVDEISAELGMSMSKPIFKWIKDSWNHRFHRKSGAIIHADRFYKALWEQSFENALITETTFPSLDGSDKNPAYMTVKLLPEQIKLRSASGELRTPKIGQKQKSWSPSNFRFQIDGLHCNYVNKIDSISVKQKTKALYFGSQRHPEIEPVGLEFGDLTFYVALAFAKPFIEWHNKFIVDGDKDLNQEKHGSIEFLGPDLSETLFTLEFTNIGIKKLSIEKSQAGQDAVKRVKVECYYERIDLSDGDGLE